MKIFFAMSVVLGDIELTQNWLEKIFMRGALLHNMTYFESNPTVFDNVRIISPTEAALSVMHKIVEAEILVNYHNPIYIQQAASISVMNIFFSIYISCRKPLICSNRNQVELSFVPDHLMSWYKDKHFIDFERYIRLLLKLREGFLTRWLYTSDGGYEDDFYYYYKGRRCALREEADLTIAPDFKVDVTILPDWTTDTFHNLLNHGAAAGWHCYMLVKYDINKRELSAEEAVSYILEESPAGKTEVSLICIINEIEHLLTFRLRFDIFFMFTLKPCAELFDLTRTVEHALNLCTDFCILELNTFDARYNYYKEPFDGEKS